MQQHPYLRAYMAGITVPTGFLIVAMTAFTLARYVLNVPIDLERVIVFPMAVVPNAWGLWNIIWQASGRRIPIGVFGAILPVPLVCGAFVLARLVAFTIPAPHILPFFFPIAVAIYYLAWKYLVAALNRIVGLVTPSASR
ncbi:MAG: hypothetical protein M3041_21125 [Acidobacteriota bacterium]|nr:hypothetical protein [Acidobacteriota bacterium]